MTIVLISALMVSSIPTGAAHASPPVPKAGTAANPISSWIVSLRTSFSPSGKMSKTAERHQQATFAAAQQDLSTSISAAGGHVDHQYQSIPALAMRLDAAQIDRFRHDPRVASITPDRVMHAATTTSTSPTPHGAQAAKVDNKKINSDKANQIGADGQGETIAIIDSGVDTTHPYLSGRIVGEACFAAIPVPIIGGLLGKCGGGNGARVGPGYGRPCPWIGCDHGTHVAGIAAGNNGVWSGVAPKAQIMPIMAGVGDSVFQPTVTFLYSNILAATEYVYSQRSNYRIAAVNMSLGDSSFTSSACDAANLELYQAVQNLASAGITTVVAAGNDGYATGVSFPACLSNVVAVGNFDNFDVPASSTNLGHQVPIVAPGVNILSSVPGGQYGFKTGTSMATPQVAGAIADLHQYVPGADPTWIRNQLHNSGATVTDTRPNGLAGYKRLDVYKAITDASVGGDDSEAAPGNPLTGFSGTLNGCSTATSGLPSNPHFFTKTYNETDHAGNQGGSSAWLSYTPPLGFSGGTVTIDTFGSSYDTLLAAYDASGKLLASNDNAGGTLQSQVLVPTASGQVVHFAIDGYRGPSDAFAASGACRVHWHFDFTHPSNDAFANALPINYDAGVVTGNNVQATIEPGEISEPGSAPTGSVWYKWTPQNLGTATVSLAGSDFETRVVVYAGGPNLSGLTRIAYNDFSTATGLVQASLLPSQLQFPVFSGFTYYFQIDGSPFFLFQGAKTQGKIRLEWSIGAPSNDDASGAPALSGVTGSIAGTNAGATAGPDDVVLRGCPDTAYGDDCHSVWYTYTAPESGALTLNMPSASYDATLYIQPDPSNPQVPQSGYNDNYYPLTTTPSIRNFPVLAGSKYWIRVDSTQSCHTLLCFVINNIAPNTGNFTLEWAMNAPTNDSFFAAQTVSGASGQVTADNTRATNEPTEGSSATPTATDASLWYVWTAPADGPVSFSTGGSNFDTGLTAWVGEIGSLSRLVADNNSGPDGLTSRIAFNATAGTQYVLSVAGIGSARGNVMLSWLQGPALTAAATVDNSTIHPGEIATTTVTVTNTSSVQADNVAVVATIAGDPGSVTQSAPPSPATASIAAGTSQDFTVAVQGNTAGTWTIDAQVSGAIAGISTTASASAGGDVIAVTPILSINDVAVNKPANGTTTADFAVSLVQGSQQTITVDYATSDGTAAQPTDYASTNGTLTFNPGVTQQTISVPIPSGPPGLTPTRAFTLSLANSVNANLGTAIGTATIQQGPTLTVGDVSVARPTVGNAIATFPITLDRAAASTISLNYATQDGTAIAGTDYVSKHGTLTFAAGATNASVRVTVKAHTGVTDERTFSLLASNIAGWVSTGSLSGTATIASLALTVQSDVANVWANGHARATLTVHASDALGNPGIGATVKVTTTPTTGVRISPRTVTTDAAGNATLTVRSTVVGVPTITLTATGHQSGTASTTINFVRHRLVVQLLDSGSTLACGAGVCTPDTDVFATMRADAVANEGFVANDFLLFSYAGGNANSSTGNWTPASYACNTTGQNLVTSIRRLAAMLRAHSNANPNTDYALAGQGLGGLIGLQELGFRSQLKGGAAITSIATLSAPLGGSPSWSTAGLLGSGCAAGKANAQLAALYATNADPAHANQGDNATMLCTTIAACPDVAGGSSNAAAISAMPVGMSVATFANNQDGAFSATACGAVPEENVSAQFVSSASGGAADLGGNPADSTCVTTSHQQAVGIDEPGVTATLGHQYATN